ncbi:putative phosphorylase b kinase regulatory subunit beta [Nymphon striatum]|nr:putative phosphorylase b kinase regulatory subunit beta [Nymphon striatum]
MTAVILPYTYENVSRSTGEMLLSSNATIEIARHTKEMKPQGRKSRLSSGTDLDFEKFDVPEYFDVLTQLDMYYGQVKRQILCNQCPTTGLFPRYPNNKKYGYIKDSIYCAAAIWSLHQAYRRIDDDRGKSMELGQSVVKCMRGILFCWMKQSKSNMEKFKKNQVPEHALHSIFDLKTGSVVPEISNYGHLQIDAVSLYLLFLVQTITSGLQIIFTMDEVNFVQNLVYYVERAYRTPDFGMWERGSKYNDGKAELHASSIGMAKAAMEAINGCNVFGEKGASWSVIYVDIDAHHRNHSIFQTMLPRESWSKNIDASLLPVISFPCFAIHDPVLYAKTKNKIIKKLEGSYGLKRFLRDGYGTVLEDEDREFYYQGETKEFEGIECEWPLFFIYLIIEGMFTGDADQVSEYQKKLSPLLRSDKNGDTIVPQYYYVDSENVAAEKANPNSQVKHPYIANNKNGCKVFMWGQSMYIISQLLVNNLLHIHELDLIRRFLPSYNRPRSLLSNRYSAFQGSASDLVVQVVLITESMRLQAMMATYGIQTQTPHEVEPVQIWSPSELVKVFEYLGVNHKLDLKGRPSRPIGALGTSKIYRVHSQTVLCYPLIFEVSDFYLSHDMAVLIDNIKKEIQFVGTNWRLSGRPTVCILIREEHMRDIHFKEMVDLLATFRTGRCEGVKIRTGRLQNLISSSCIEHLDFLNTVTDIKSEFIPFKQVKHASIGYQSLTDIKSAVYLSEPQQSFSFFKTKPTHEIIDTLMYMESMQGQSRLLGMLLEREGPNLHLSNGTVKESLEKLARKAGEIRNWSVVRYCSSLLGKLVDSISPYITSILVSGKQVQKSFTVYQ